MPPQNEKYLRRRTYITHSLGNSVNTAASHKQE